MRTIVYADGGADPNPGPGGWGVVIQAPKGSVELCGGERMTTNNRMELTAAIRALSHFPEGAAIEMRCDSQYVVKSVTEWMPGWKRRGWRTATGPVKNQDLMEQLDALASRRDVRWTWVRGHAGEDGNERADRLATQGRQQVLNPGMPAQVAPASRVQPVAPLVISSTLAKEIARTAEEAGTSPQTLVDEALRLAIDAGPEGLKRLRRSLSEHSLRA